MSLPEHGSRVCAGKPGAPAADPCRSVGDKLADFATRFRLWPARVHYIPSSFIESNWIHQLFSNKYSVLSKWESLNGGLFIAGERRMQIRPTNRAYLWSVAGAAPNSIKSVSSCSTGIFWADEATLGRHSPRTGRIGRTNIKPICQHLSDI